MHSSYSTLRYATVFVLLLSIFVVVCSASKKSVKRQYLPPGIHEDMIPAQEFDSGAPFCKEDKEPCGFYSFSLFGNNNGGPPFRWVKSWCRCTPEQSCTFSHADTRRRMYKHICTSKNAVTEESEEDDYS